MTAATPDRLERAGLVKLALLTVLALAAAAAWVALGSTLAPRRDTTTQRTAQSLLEKLEQEDAGWNVDVLSAGLGLDTTYDAIAGRKQRVDAALSALAALASQGGGDPGMRGRVDILRKVFEEKADVVETFKSHQSILRNSLRYLSTAGEEARGVLDAGEGDAKAREAARATLDAALSQALRYAVVGDEDQRSRLSAATRSLDEAVARMSDAAPAKAQLLIVLTHLQTVLHQKPDVEALLRAIVDSPTRKVLEDSRPDAPH